MSSRRAPHVETTHPRAVGTKKKERRRAKQATGSIRRSPVLLRLSICLLTPCCVRGLPSSLRLENLESLSRIPRAGGGGKGPGRLPLAFTPTSGSQLREGASHARLHITEIPISVAAVSEIRPRPGPEFPPQIPDIAILLDRNSRDFGEGSGTSNGVSERKTTPSRWSVAAHAGDKRHRGPWQRTQATPLAVQWRKCTCLFLDWGLFHCSCRVTGDDTRRCQGLSSIVVTVGGFVPSAKFDCSHSAT